MKHFVSALALACLGLLPGAASMAQPPPAFSPNVINLPDLVAPVDLEEIGLQLGQCLGRSLTVLEPQVNGRGDRLAVELEPYGDDPQAGDRFSVSMRYNEAADRWEPTNFVIFGQLNVAARGGRSIRVQGLVSSEEAETLHAAVNRYWASQLGSETVRIDSIVSSRGPELSCQYESLEPHAASVHYDVVATNSSLPTFNELDLPQGRIVDIGSRPLAPLYHFHLGRAAPGGPLEVDRVSCESSPYACDEHILASLQAGSSGPGNPLDDTDLRTAMLSSLPAAFRHAEIHKTQTLWRGDRETVVIHLGEVAISSLRKAGSNLSCRRFLSEPAEWECEHRIFSQTQSIPGSDLQVRLTGGVDLSEEAVMELVDTLFAYFSDGSLVRLTLSGIREGGYHVRFFSNEGNRTRMRQAWFSKELELQRLE